MLLLIEEPQELAYGNGWRGEMVGGGIHPFTEKSSSALIYYALFSQVVFFIALYLKHLNSTGSMSL